ncbi:hypothetical protein Hamer_G016586 [Homarus americanus]|uniref:Uncharacterized protein n=1 Tax=Homarus americanus TaxID=6706 RepID=A0A8J5JKN0_HOMAM|nr:hypothetical protein Hamer_G016586 [Homarus americanus]
MKLLVILFSLTALTWAQDQPHCRCGGFITESEEEVEVFNLPTFQVENCEAEQGCRELCRMIVVLYSKLCDGPWEMGEESSNEELCCKGGQYVTCM